MGKKSKEYAKRNPYKIKAMAYVNNNKLRGDICVLCLSNKNLNLHHTDYINNVGFTICSRCHNQFHSMLIEDCQIILNYYQIIEYNEVTFNYLDGIIRDGLYETKH